MFATVVLVDKRTCLASYHAACNVDIRPFNRSYSQLGITPSLVDQRAAINWLATFVDCQHAGSRHHSSRTSGARGTRDAVERGFVTVCQHPNIGKKTRKACAGEQLQQYVISTRSSVKYIYICIYILYISMLLEQEVGHLKMCVCVCVFFFLPNFF